MKNLIHYISGYQELSWLNSGGTRNKKILSADNEVYYFKESFNNGKGKFYKYEFYSEVIASFLGNMFDLDVLKYSIAVYKTQIGCLSKSMIQNNEELIEVGKYLKAFDSSFIIDKENPKEKYNFQLVVNALSYFSLENNIDKLIDMVIFDSIIGNSDRHQENWGFIVKHNIATESIKEIEKSLSEEKSRFDILIHKMLSFFGVSNVEKHKILSESNRLKLNDSKNIRFSPIYDSGCCLGRELSEEKVQVLLEEEHKIQKYIDNGLAEIHWEDKKVNHFDLLKKISENDRNIKIRVREIVGKFNTKEFREFVFTLDKKIPEDFEEYRISENRKELIVKLVTLRIEILRKFSNE